MRHHARLLRMIALFSALALLFSAKDAYAGQVANKALSKTGGHLKQISVELIAPPNVALHQPLALTVHIRPLMDAPAVALRWSLPAGVTLLDGPMNESIGDLKANQIVTLLRTIRIDNEGVQKVGVEAGFSPDPVAQFGDAGILYFDMGDWGGRVTATDPERAAKLREKVPLGPNSGFTVSAAATQPDATGAICVNITGRFIREDKVWNGTTQVTNIVPVKHAVIEIWESDLIFDDHDGTTTPDENGFFGWTDCSDDGFFDDTLELYVKAIGQAEGTVDEVIATLETQPPLFIDLPDIPFTSDGMYEVESEIQTISEPGDLVFDNMTMNTEQSGAMNIIDTIYEAWRFWQDNDGNDNRTEYDDIDVYWSDDGDYGTYYVGILDNLYITGSDPDQFDDSVIIHEWTHFADDKWSCDGNPGGEHTGFDIVDSELAFGEGFPDFYQVVVRTALGEPMSTSYVDLNGLGTCSVCIDIENWPGTHTSSVHVNNEISDAAALWDLVDTNNDGLDTYVLPQGYPFVEGLYINPAYTDVNIGACDFGTYFQAWKGIGGPTDAGAAAAIVQNTGLTNIFTAQASTASGQTDSAQEVALQDAAPQSATSTQDNGDTESDFRWWDRLAFIVDNSKSMAGERIDAIKEVLQGEVDDIFAERPKGVEMRLDTFNNTSSTNQLIYKGQFFPAQIKPGIAGLTTTSADDGACPIDAFGALKQVAEGQSNLKTWLFTDGYPAATSSPLESFRAELANNDISASFAVLQSSGGGSCLSPGTSPKTVLRQKQFQRQLLFTAGNAPTEPSNSIVPYLLTSLATGGQFLFVDEGKMEDAAAILKAQLKHNAGAGRWSDYVSTQQTYRYDKLASWEYEWVDGETTGTALADRPGGLSSEDYVDVTLPQGTIFYSRPVTTAHVYENGYLTFDDNFAEQNENSQLPDANPPNAAVYPYWDDLEWEQLLAAATNAPDAPSVEYGVVYTATQGDWFVIEYSNYASTTAPDHTETFEVLLNKSNGEIRYQYKTIANGVAGATIGLEIFPDFSPVDGVQVAYNQTNGAASGMGYRFVPVPPQPSKLYSVTVDSTMESIGFLLTGYNGTFAPLAIQSPNGPIACDAPGVLCITVGLVQYVQVNVNGRTGLWKSTVTPGASGSGTYSFSSMAAGLLPVNNPSNHTLPSFGTSVFTLNLGHAVDGNRLDAHFLTPANQAFGAQFALFDDGGHGDGGAGDGQFGSVPVTPSGIGTAYLWVNGKLNNESFQRVESKPYSFQPVDLQAPDSVASLSAKTIFSVTLTNADTLAHDFAVDIQVPHGWRGGVVNPGDVTVTVGAGLSVTFPISVSMGVTDQVALDQPSGATGNVNVSAVEVEQGVLYDSATIAVTRKRLPARIVIVESYPFLHINSSAAIKFSVYDDQDEPVVDGSLLTLDTTVGTLTPKVSTINGFAQAVFQSGANVGVAHISARSSNGVTATLEIPITPPMPEKIVLSSTVSALSGAAATPLMATVIDMNGKPVAGQPVRVGVEGGGDKPKTNAFGTVNGGEVVTGTTDVNGQFQITFNRGNHAGTASIRAELLHDGVIIGVDRIYITLDSPNVLVLPYLRR